MHINKGFYRLNLTMQEEGNAITRFIDRAIRFFLYVLIFWLPYSPAVIETCVIIGLLLFIVKRLYIFSQDNNKSISKVFKCLRPKHSILNAPIFLFLGVCFISVVASPVYEIAFRGLISKVAEWFVIYFLILEVFKTRNHFFIALLVLIFTAASTALDSFWQYFISHKDVFLGHTIGPGMRATAGFKTPNGLGAYLTLFIPFIISTVWYFKKTLYKILTIGIAFLSLGSLVLAFSRGAVLGVVAGISFFLYLKFLGKKHKVRYIFGYFLLFLIIGIIAASIMNNAAIVKALNRSGTADGRIVIWKETLSMIKDRPLFGHGINTYMRLFQHYRKVPTSSPTFAHNCYLQMTAEVGIIGLLTLLLIIVKLFVSCFQLMSQRESATNYYLSLGLLSGIFAFLVHSFFDNNFYSLQLSAFLWYMIGLYVISLRLKLN